MQIALLSLYAIMVFAFLTVSPTLWYDMNLELAFSYTTLNNSYGVSAATLSIGCIIFTPFAMRFGRRPVYIVTSLLIVAADAWSAKMQTVPDIMLTNVIMGAAGSVNEALFQMTVNDLFFVHQRGTLNGVLFLCTIIGGYLAPVASGYVAIGQDWRWVFWYLTIFQATISLLMILFLEETKYVPDPGVAITVPASNLEAHHSIAIEGRAEPIPEKMEKGPSGGSSKDLADIRQGSIMSILYTQHDANAVRRLVEIDRSIPKRPWKRRYALYTTDGETSSYEWWRHFTQPFVLMVRFPVIAFAALEWAFCLSALSLVAVSTSNLYPYPPYNFSAIGVGNMNISPAIGAILGTIWGGPCVDWTILKLAQRNDGIYEPEMRLALFILPAVLMPIGVFVYGLCTALGMVWIIPALGSAFIGFAIGGSGDIALTYLQDSYTEILADALIGVAFARNILACILVFVIQPWFDGMGVYNAFVLLGCIAIAFSLLGVPMYFYGKWTRVKCAKRYRYYAGKQFVLRSL